MDEEADFEALMADGGLPDPAAVDSEDDEFELGMEDPAAVFAVAPQPAAGAPSSDDDNEEVGAAAAAAADPPVQVEERRPGNVFGKVGERTKEQNRLMMEYCRTKKSEKNLKAGKRKADQVETSLAA